MQLARLMRWWRDSSPAFVSLESVAKTTAGDDHYESWNQTNHRREQEDALLVSVLFLSLRRLSMTSSRSRIS